MSYVLGTAGHVDHGKSLLIRALTGIDPDRLNEEKERGMTIDLGFAWLELPGGREVGIVDVPGHEHFIKNMLAGVGGIDLALVVVAADESVMPQTREHVAILDLLNVERGIAVITKKDLVDEELVALVKLELGELLADTALARIPVVAVSALTGEGLPELVSLIEQVLASAPPKKDIGRPRLPVDRVFTIAGFGTVVTGTLVDGSLSVGQEIEALPQGIRGRIRGLQTHKRKLQVAAPGSRVAANLSGVATTDLDRGDVITIPGWLVPGRAFDVRLRLLRSASRPLRHNAVVSFFHGTGETLAKVRLLEADVLEPGETTWAQLLLERSVPAVKDDRFIIRSPQETLGGGQIVRPWARRHRRFRAEVIERLSAREGGSTEGIVLSVIRQEEPLEMDRLVALSNLSDNEAEETAKRLAAQGRIVVLGETGLFYSAEGWGRLAGGVTSAVAEHHKHYPLRHGLPKEELRARLKVPAKFFPRALEKLFQEGRLVEVGPVVRLPEHTPQPTTQQQEAMESFLAALGRNPYSPVIDRLPEPDLLNLLIERRQVIKVSDDVIFLATAYDRMVDEIIARIKAEGKVTVAGVRDMLHTSRKYALALMEYLDSQRITRRSGDERVLR